MSVDELSVEISNNSEMYDFIRLKKEIYAAYLDLSRKFALLKCVEEPILNLRAIDNLNQANKCLTFKHFNINFTTSRTSRYFKVALAWIFRL